MSELADDSFDTVESIKHNATKTGMLDVAGVEEVIKVHDAWCGYLLRRARRTSASEEDADVAEMGIRTSIENVESIACKLDLDASFETSFRLQRKYIEYLRGQGRLDNARKQFDDLVPVYGKHYKFWLRFYEVRDAEGCTDGPTPARCSQRRRLRLFSTLRYRGP